MEPTKIWETIGDCWNVLKCILSNKRGIHTIWSRTIPRLWQQLHFSFWNFFLECNFMSKRPLSLLTLPILHKWETLFLLCFVFQKWTYQRRNTDKNQEKITMCCLKSIHSSVTISRVLEQISQFYLYQTRNLRSWRQPSVLQSKRNTKNTFFLSVLSEKRTR